MRRMADQEAITEEIANMKGHASPRHPGHGHHHHHHGYDHRSMHNGYASPRLSGFQYGAPPGLRVPPPSFAPEFGSPRMRPFTPPYLPPPSLGLPPPMSPVLSGLGHPFVPLPGVCASPAPSARTLVDK